MEFVAVGPSLASPTGRMDRESASSGHITAQSSGRRIFRDTPSFASTLAQSSVGTPRVIQLLRRCGETANRAATTVRPPCTITACRSSCIPILHILWIALSTTRGAQATQSVYRPAMTERPIDVTLRLARAKGWNQTDLATEMGVTPADISNWKSRGMPSDKLIGAATCLQVTVDELLGRTVKEPEPEYAGRVRAAKRVPIVGTARMGDDGYYDEISAIPGAGDGHIDIQTDDPNAYGLRVRGDSMMPAIRDGWYVLVEPNGCPNVGEYVLLKLHTGQRMVKELLYERDDSIGIMSVNGDLRRTIYRDELDSMQAVAAVVSPSKWKPD